MSVSKVPSLFIASCLVGMLAGCADLPLVGGRGHMPAPGVKQAAHPPLRPELAALPAAGSGRGGYYLDDGPGENPPPDLEQIPDAEVRAEPYSRYANRPYVVFGKTYTPMLSEQPFRQRGMSSWYGKKFHGQKTSSGEIYDMYKMTAAHPTLPIPSFARITSVATGKQVVVRINDRGPFHSSRIVDVSYTAAVKLGLLKSGSQEVHLERLLPDAGTRLATLRRSAEDEPARQGVLQAADEVEALVVESKIESKAQAPQAGFYVQMGAFSRADKAAQVRSKIAQSGWDGVLDVVAAGALHKVLSGPFASRDEALAALREVPGMLGLRPIVIKR